MKKLKKIKMARAIAAALSVLLLGQTVAAALRVEDSLTIGNTEISVIVANEDNNYVMQGAHNTSLLVKSISSEDYMTMMNSLYPNGVIDAQGQDVPGIENIPEVRAQFIAEHMKAYSMDGTTKTEIELSPFTISIMDQSNGQYAALFYKASIGQDSFVFPSEWGSQPFGFVHASDKGIYLAFTDMGIWSINPNSETAQKITTDSYLGESQADISAELQTQDSGEYLIWVDSVAISPNGSYVIYRTNRDADALNETSLWKIELNSNSEEQFVAPAINNDIVGFISDNKAVIGSLGDTRMVDVSSSSTIALDIPEISNSCVKSAKDGVIVVSSYNDGSSNTTAYISDVDNVTGAVTEITQVSGYLDGIPQFSPSGNKVAIGYGTDAMVGVDDVMIVDLSTTAQTLLTDSIATTRSVQTINSNVTGCLWIDDEALLVNTQQENDLPSVDAPESATRASAYDIVFGNTILPLLTFNSPLSSTSSSGFVNVNSKWNQPRTSGTNPHNGVDLQAALDTPVYAPWAGWVIGINVVGNADIQFLVDANNDRVQNDGDYYVRFYHLNSREANGYKTKGALIGYSGNQGGYPAHLHFGICSISGGLKWFRNEVNYRHLSSANWNAGQDLDIYGQVRWNNNTPSLIAYAHDETGTKALTEVRMYYRTTISGAWTDGGVMTKSGNTYSYNFNGKFSTGTTVYWMVRLTRGTISQRAFCPAKFYQPTSNPNSSSYAYGYWTNTMS